MKNPGLPLFAHSSGPAGLPLYVATLDIQTPWEPLLPSPAYPKLRFVSQLGLANCLPYHIAVTFISHILTIPYVLSLILTIAIYAMPPPP